MEGDRVDLTLLGDADGTLATIDEAVGAETRGGVDATEATGPDETEEKVTCRETGTMATERKTADVGAGTETGADETAVLRTGDNRGGPR